MKLPLQGRVALVTGAQRGMGAAIARLLAAQGAAVCLNDLDEAGLAVAAARITAAGGRAITYAGSVTS
jgi:NAD(P)-dependent dehydrogenase (short-subunit alcohol dehydrogenase family)